MDLSHNPIHQKNPFVKVYDNRWLQNVQRKITPYNGWIEVSKPFGEVDTYYDVNTLDYDRRKWYGLPRDVE